jgi:NAD(P)-dependent dehydrogenase (short-subunit alcohol dehydrogenase family)
VNLYFISGRVGQAFIQMGYNGAKAAIHTMTKAAAMRFDRGGICVKSVPPGYMLPIRSSLTSAAPAGWRKWPVPCYSWPPKRRPALPASSSR